MVFGVGVVVVVYVVPAVEKKTQSKSGKTQKTRKKKREKKSLLRSQTRPVSLSHVTTPKHAKSASRFSSGPDAFRSPVFLFFSLLSFFALPSLSLSLSLSLRSRFFFSLGRRSLLKKLLLYKIHLSLSPIHPSFHPSSSSSTHRVHSHYYLLLLDITD